jgi:hypothetical protein
MEGLIEEGKEPLEGSLTRPERTSRGFMVSFAGTNLLARPLPFQTDLPLLIVGAHYDRVRDTPGADDNASAVAALLELAPMDSTSFCSSGTWFCQLELVAYDLEESAFPHH